MKSKANQNKTTPTQSLGAAAALNASATLNSSTRASDINDLTSRLKLLHYLQHLIYTSHLREHHTARTAHTMPHLQPTCALRASRSLSSTLTLTARPTTSTIRSFSSTPSPKAADHAHEDHYDPPTGWLFGVKPGEKAEKEGWENVWTYGFFGSLALGVVGYAFKPDTS